MHLKLTGMFFNLASWVHRDWAAEQLSRLWFTVFQPKPKHSSQVFWREADQSIELHLHDKIVQAYSWGQGPLVVCVHGWAGSGTQFRQLVPRLVQAGYRVVTFDAPAHGANPDKQTDVMEFAQCLHAIDAQIAPIDTVVAHSFGAMAALVASYMGQQPRRMVLLAPGLDVIELFERYSTAMQLKPRLRQRLRERVGEKMARVTPVANPWWFFRPHNIMQYAAPSGLLIYDREDEEVSQAQFRAGANHWPTAQTVETSGLGHYRILKDSEVIERIVGWLGRADRD